MEKNKKFNMDKHVVDTLNKYEDGPDIQQQVINNSPVKVTPKRKNTFNELVKENEKEYKANQKNKKILPAEPVEEEKSLWDLMKESARIDARKGDRTAMKDIKRTLHDNYKKSGGKWMIDEELKMIGKYKPPKPLVIDLESVNKGRLLLAQMREDDKRLAQQRKKIFEKKSGHENFGGLAYLLNSKG